MNCPVCDDTRMKEVEKNGILIDVCPSCKGVWLDRGELDKLMSGVREIRREYDERDYDGKRTRPPQYAEHRDRYEDDYRHSKHKKKKSVLDVLGDLFD